MAIHAGVRKYYYKASKRNYGYWSVGSCQLRVVSCAGVRVEKSKRGSCSVRCCAGAQGSTHKVALYIHCDLAEKPDGKMPASANFVGKRSVRSRESGQTRGPRSYTKGRGE